MPLTSPLLAAALATAALAAPAAATTPSTYGQDYLYTVSVSGSTLHYRLDAACAFRPDRWTADYGPTQIDGVATAPGAIHTSVRCEIYLGGDLMGEAGNAATGPVAVASASDTAVGSRPHITVCVTAEASFGYLAALSETRCVNP